MRILILTLLLISQGFTHASVLSDSILNIESSIRANSANKALADLDVLEAGLKVEERFDDYKEIIFSLKAFSYYLLGDFSNSSIYSSKALKVMNTREPGDEIVKKYKPVMSSLNQKINARYPLAYLKPTFNLDEKVEYISYKDDTSIDTRYKYAINIDITKSTKCEVHVSTLKTDKQDAKNSGLVQNSSDWAYHYVIDMKRTKRPEFYSYSGTNTAYFLRFTNRSDKKFDYRRIKYKAGTKEVKSEKTFYEKNYVDLIIANSETYSFNGAKKKELLEGLWDNCNDVTNKAVQKKVVKKSTFQDSLNEINKLLAEPVYKKAWDWDGNVVSEFYSKKILFNPYESKCGGTLEIQETVDIPDSNEDVYKFESIKTEITDPNSLSFSFKHQDYYYSVTDSKLYKKDEKRLEWIFYGWIKNSNTFEHYGYYREKSGAERTINYHSNIQNNKSYAVHEIVGDYYYKIETLMEKFKQQISCQ